ncbi:hypothetical protein AOLI_G00269990 [Acnodon oligacanthus]
MKAEGRTCAALRHQKRRREKNLQHKTMETTSEDELKLVIPRDLIESLGHSVTIPCHLSPEINAVAMEIRWFKGTNCVCLYKNRQVTEGRGYEGRVSLFKEELEKGDVSLQLRQCEEQDTGYYLCQVTTGFKTEELTVAVQMLSDKFGLIHKLVKVEEAWTEEERMKMEESVLLTEFKASNMVELFRRINEERIQEKEKLLQQLKEACMARDNTLEEQKKTEAQMQHIEKMLTERDQWICALEAEVERFKQLDDPQTTENMETSDLDTSCQKRRSLGQPPSMAAEAIGASPELRLVLLGRTGCGKRAVGNTILGTEEKSQAGASTVGQQSESRKGEVAGRQVTVVDTPDWFCPGLSLEELRQDVGLCVRLSAPGPHAFLLVIPVKQSTGEETGMLEKMEEIFWERCWRNTMILFIVTEEAQEKDTEEFIQSGNQEVQRLVEKCENRFHCLSIKESGDGSQTLELLEKIEEMVAANEGAFYSSEIYHEIREMENRIIKEKEENKKRAMEKLKEKQEKEIQDALKSITEQIRELEERLQQLEQQITELESLLKQERNDEMKRQLEMKLQREIQQKEEIQQQLNDLMEKCNKMKSELEERHRQEMADIIEMYDGEARREAERNLMKIILPELHRTVWVLISKMQKQFLVKMEQKDRELSTLKQRLSELTETYRQLEVDYQALRSRESTEAGRGEEREGGAAVGGDGEVEETQDEVGRLSKAGQDDGDEKRTEGERKGYKDKGEAEKTEVGVEEENRTDGQEESRGSIRRILCCCFSRVYEPVEMQQI